MPVNVVMFSVGTYTASKHAVLSWQMFTGSIIISMNAHIVIYSQQTSISRPRMYHYDQ